MLNLFKRLAIFTITLISALAFSLTAFAFQDRVIYGTPYGYGSIQYPVFVNNPNFNVTYNRFRDGELVKKDHEIYNRMGVQTNAVNKLSYNTIITKGSKSSGNYVQITNAILDAPYFRNSDGQFLEYRMDYRQSPDAFLILNSAISADTDGNPGQYRMTNPQFTQDEIYFQSDPRINVLNKNYNFCKIPCPTLTFIVNGSERWTYRMLYETLGSEYNIFIEKKSLSDTTDYLEDTIKCSILLNKDLIKECEQARNSKHYNMILPILREHDEYALELSKHIGLQNKAWRRAEAQRELEETQQEIERLEEEIARYGK